MLTEILPLLEVHEHVPGHEEREKRGRAETIADVLDDGESLSTIEPASQDFIVANHFLEHCENPIGTIENHLGKLRPGGILFYAVPDKRFTFDYPRDVTPLEHMISDYEHGPEGSRSEHFDDWARLTYEKRRFFEWGGWLAVRPIDELPYYRVVMRRERTYGRMWPYMRDHSRAVDEVRELLRERGEMTNRDFVMAERTRVNSYRGRKDSALALHYLWRIGEAMVTRRERFERGYALTERVASNVSTGDMWSQAAKPFFIIMFNIVADVMYGVLDPRIRYD